VAIVGVAWSGSEDEFQEFVDRHGLTFPQISDAAADVFTRFGVPAQPAWAFVLPDGEVQTLLGAVDDETLDGLISAALA
jgi:peroxiredoxin